MRRSHRGSSKKYQEGNINFDVRRHIQIKDVVLGGSIDLLALKQKPIVSSKMFSNIYSIISIPTLLVSLVSPFPSSQFRSARDADLISAPGKAAYLITNDGENGIAALRINSDGTLSEGTVTPTGGKGSNVLVPGGTAKQAPDALVSQACLAIVEDVSSICKRLLCNIG